MHVKIQRGAKVVLLFTYCRIAFLQMKSEKSTTICLSIVFIHTSVKKNGVGKKLILFSKDALN